jgi:hypothetical protein
MEQIYCLAEGAHIMPVRKGDIGGEQKAVIDTKNGLISGFLAPAITPVGLLTFKRHQITSYELTDYVFISEESDEYFGYLCTRDDVCKLIEAKPNPNLPVS